MGCHSKWGIGLAGIFAASTHAGAFEAADILSIPWHSFVFKPQLTVQSTFTDNVFYGNDSITAASIFRPVIISGNTAQFGPITTNNIVLRRQESDLITYVTPGLQVQYGAPAGNRINLFYQFDQAVYLQHPAENTSQNHVALGTTFDSGAFSIRGSDQINFLSSLLGGGSGSGILGLVVNRRTWDDIYNFRLDVSDKTYLYAKAVRNDIDYDSGTPLLDYNTVAGTLGAAYSPAAKLALTVDAVYGQTAVSANTVLREKSPHSQVIGANLGVRGEFTPKIEGTIKVGLETRSFPGLADPHTTTSPAFDLAITYNATLKTMVQLTYSRRSDVSGNFGSQSLSDNSVGILVQEQLGPSGKWTLAGRASGYIRDFSSVQLPVAVLASDARGNILFDQTGRAVYSSVSADYARSETGVGIGIQVNYQPRPWLTTSLSYDLSQYTSRFRDARVDSTHPFIDYVDNRATFRIGIGF